jgi:hypothetical protein
MNTDVNAFNDAGLTIMQDAHDDEILTFKSSDVAHGMTDHTDTNSYCTIKKDTGPGGASIKGYTGGTDVIGMSITGIGATENTNKQANSSGALHLYGGKANGAGIQQLTVDGNMVCIGSATSDIRLIVDRNGDVHYDGGTNANDWDDHDDIGLLNTFRNLTTSNKAQDVFGEFIDENAQILHDTGVITMNDDGHHFVSTKGLNALIIDTIRQEGQKWRSVIGNYKDKITALESRLMRLEA